MRVKLLKDKLENGQVKVTVSRKRRTSFAWFAGNELDVSPETAKKLFAAGEAVEVAVPEGPGPDLDEQTPERQAAIEASRKPAKVEG